MKELEYMAGDYGIYLNETMLNQFDNYYRLLLEWNQKFNLTAITDRRDIIIKHFLDSLLLCKYLTIHDGLSLADVGTGAGFPGIPVGIAAIGIDIALIDSLRKRTVFLHEVARALKLEGVLIYHGRAEELGHSDFHREAYDYVTARAVAPLRILAEYCLPFVKVGGYFIAMKGPSIDNELQDAREAITLLGGDIFDIQRYNLPDESARTLVRIKKISQTPIIYPRKQVKIAKATV